MAESRKTGGMKKAAMGREFLAGGAAAIATGAFAVCTSESAVMPRRLQQYRSQMDVAGYDVNLAPPAVSKIVPPKPAEKQE